MQRGILMLGLMSALVGAGACRSDAPAPPGPLAGAEPARGRAAVEKYGCGACHAVPGIPGADATVGPSLAAIGTRAQLAGEVPNTPENMLRWIQRPHEIKKDAAMPEMGVTDQDARDIAAYLYTLR